MRRATGGGKYLAPRWFVEFAWEAMETRKRLIQALGAIGYMPGDGQVNAKSEVFHGISSVEARLVRGALRRLRHQRGVFSHYLVHDGVYIDCSIDEHLVVRTFHDEARHLGLNRVVVAKKSWDTPRRDYHRLLRKHRYTFDANIPIPRVDQGSSFKEQKCPDIAPS